VHAVEAGEEEAEETAAEGEEKAEGGEE